MRIETPATQPSTLQRPTELEDWLNRRIFHPASLRVARLLAPTPVTPDMVSVAGALIVMLAGWCYTFVDTVTVVMVGCALHLSWHVIDGADGDLARLTGRCSPRGELVDGMCDIVGHVVLYLLIGSIAVVQIGPQWGWGLTFAAGGSRLLQAAHYEGWRRQYQQIVYGTPWLGNADHRGAQGASRNVLAKAYRFVVGLVAPQARALAVASRSAAEASGVSAAFRAEARHLLGPMTPLCANYRTIAAGLAMLAGRPHWFFLFEVVALNAVLVFSAFNSRRVIDRVLAGRA